MLLFGVFSTKLKQCSCLIALLMSVGPLSDKVKGGSYLLIPLWIRDRII